MRRAPREWIPASAGMTDNGGRSATRIGAGGGVTLATPAALSSPERPLTHAAMTIEQPDAHRLTEDTEALRDQLHQLLGQRVGNGDGLGHLQLHS